MTHLLIKPIVFLFIVGLVGCTTTKWAALVQTEDEIRNPHIRVTLIDKSQFELYNVIITRETISGFTNHNRPFTIRLERLEDLSATLEFGLGRRDFLGQSHFGGQKLGVLANHRQQHRRGEHRKSRQRQDDEHDPVARRGRPRRSQLAGDQRIRHARPPEGRSLAACMRGESPAPAPVFAESGRSYFPELVRRRVHNGVPGRFRAVVQGDFKLIYTPFADDAWELYDVAGDPHETRDLYSADHPAVAGLEAALEAWLARAPKGAPPRHLLPEDEAALRELGYLE